jgi:hypothetical protein
LHSRGRAEHTVRPWPLPATIVIIVKPFESARDQQLFSITMVFLAAAIAVAMAAEESLARGALSFRQKMTGMTARLVCKSLRNGIQ